jgi:hypothetical protein
MTQILISDVYETIKGHLENYLKTGDTKTPNRGRGQRVPKKNSRYALQTDSENDDTSSPKKVCFNDKAVCECEIQIL